MAFSADACLRRHSKKVPDPDFVYDLPTGALFQDALNLEPSNSENLQTQDAGDATKPRRTKCNINWPQDFVLSIQGDYDKLELPEFVSGF